MADNVQENVTGNTESSKRKKVLTFYNRGKMFTFVKSNSVLVGQKLSGNDFTYLGPGFHFINPLIQYNEVNGDDDKFTVSFDGLLRTSISGNATDFNSSGSNNFSEGIEVKVGDVDVYYQVGDIQHSLPSKRSVESEYEADLRRLNPIENGEDPVAYEDWIEYEMSRLSCRHKINQLYRHRMKQYLRGTSIKSVSDFVVQDNSIEQVQAMVKEIIIKIVNNSSLIQLKSKLAICRDNLPDYLSDELKQGIRDRLDFIKNNYGVEIISFSLGDVDLPQKLRDAHIDKQAQEVENYKNVGKATADLEVAKLNAEAQKALKGVDYELIIKAIESGKVDANGVAMILTRFVTGPNVTTFIENGATNPYLPFATSLYNQYAPQKDQDAQNQQDNSMGRSR